jgi:hypothetical protein
MHLPTQMSRSLSIKYNIYSQQLTEEHNNCR